jgi:hypothetical protein
MDYRQILTISGKGSGSDQFAETLNGICVDQTGSICAVGDRAVKVFDSQGKLQRKWQTDKPGYCVAVDDEAAVYVGQSGQIEKFDGAGNHLTTFRDGERLGTVTAIDFFGENMLIADAADRCIRRYDKTGKWLGDIGKDNNTKGFLIPNGHLDFDVDAAGIIHAANPAKHRIERYTMTGELLGYFGKFGTHEPQDFPGCCNPTNLTLTEQGNVVVTEKAGPRLKVYAAPDIDAQGAGRTRLRSSKTSPSARVEPPDLLAVVGPELFDPNCKNMDVAVDSQGRIYVADTVQLVIKVFAPEPTAVGAAERSESPAMQGASDHE